MTAAFSLLSELTSCGGRTVVLQVERHDDGSLALALATLVAELDAAGEPVRA
ncbi:MAG: hypothetical protein H7138_26470, partial [Myxococcales bacterium]|nr:hypothetical protein [Myxococcales bacterium]